MYSWGHFFLLFSISCYGYISENVKYELKLEAFKDIAREIYRYVYFQLSVGKLVDVLSGKV